MTTTKKLRTSLALFLAMLGATVALAPATALAEDNDDSEINKEEACYYLQDGYERASQIASDARAAGDMATYYFYSDLAAEIYLDAEFDWECDWATEFRPPKHHPFGDLLPTEAVDVAPGDDGRGPIGPPKHAGKNARAYERWLQSANHRKVCKNQELASLALRGISDRYEVVDVAAHFAGCGWAKDRLPAMDPPPTAPVGPHGSDGTVAPPPAGADDGGSGDPVFL